MHPIRAAVSRLLQRGKKQRGQDGDDRNDDKQFDERESVRLPMHHVASQHGSASGTRSG